MNLITLRQTSQDYFNKSVQAKYFHFNFVTFNSRQRGYLPERAYVPQPSKYVYGFQEEKYLKSSIFWDVTPCIPLKVN
jgi:hypothetical protein